MIHIASSSVDNNISGSKQVDSQHKQWHRSNQMDILSIQGLFFLHYSGSLLLHSSGSVTISIEQWEHLQTTSGHKAQDARPKARRPHRWPTAKRCVFSDTTDSQSEALWLVTATNEALWLFHPVFPSYSFTFFLIFFSFFLFHFYPFFDSSDLIWSDLRHH